MKTSIILPFILLSTQLLFAQQKTEAYFGVSGRTDVSKDIVEMYDKGYYIAGGFEGNPYHFGWNIKTDVNLEMIYNTVFEHSLCSLGNFSVITDEYGNVYITGLATINDEWPFVLKIDSCGNKLWCKILIYEDEFNYGWSSDIILTGNDEVVILATLINDEQPADQINMTHLIGLSDQGEVLWKKPYASRNDYSWIRQPIGNTIFHINNDFYISGSCYWPYPDDTTHWFLRPLFIGIDSLFEEKWILPFAPVDSIFGVAFNTIPLSDTVLMGVGYRLSESEIYNSILMFYDLNGNELGYTQFTNESIGNNIDFNAIRDVKTINNSLYISPYFIGIGGETYFGEFVYDTSGAIYNHTIRDIYKGNSSILKTSDNNYVIEIEVAESKSDDDIYVYKIDENLNDVPFDPTPHIYDSLCPGSIQSGTIDLTSCFVWTDIGEAPSPKEYYSLIATIPIIAYPNPAETEITLAFQNTEHHSNMLLECFNIYGQKVHSEKIWKGQQHTKLSVSEWSEGLYFAVVKSEGKVAGTGRFVRR